MDEHSQSVIQAAADNDVEPQVWVDRMADRFADFWRRLHCTNDDWIRTTEPRHVHSVQTLLTRIQDRNPDDLFLGEYEGEYCVGCEEFKQPNQIEDGHCIEHPTLVLQSTKETNHFFRLSRYGDRLLSAIQDGSFKVEPAIRRNEVLRLIESGLQDISISRSRFPWGIPFPADPEHTVYVWFDALINYLSGTGFPEEGYDRLWPADLHIIGKGITRFHCVIWPAMLMAAGLELPKEVWAHGYVQWEGSKMSKTTGTAVSLETAILRHGPDALRFFLMREIGFEADGNFTWERFDERYISDLADGLGNLASRVLAMIAKFRGGVVPDAGATSLDEAGAAAVADYQQRMDGLDLRGGAEAAWDLVAAGNLYVAQTAPWALAKAGKEDELDAALAALARCLFRLSIMVSPFMPEKAEELWRALGQEGQAARSDWQTLDLPPVVGCQTTKGAGLFPKVPQA